MPFAIVLGEDELAQGKVRIKEMGLREGHPEKDGVLVDMSALVREVKARLIRKEQEAKEGEGEEEGKVGDGGGVEGAAGNLEKALEGSKNLKLDDLPSEERIT